MLTVSRSNKSVDGINSSKRMSQFSYDHGQLDVTKVGVNVLATQVIYNFKLNFNICRENITLMPSDKPCLQKFTYFIL